MPITPTFAGDTIYMGAAHLVIDKGATPLVPATWSYLFCKGAVTVRLVRPVRDVQVAGYGTVAEPSTDETVELTFTPTSRLDAAVLAFLWGDILAKMPGASWFGSTNHPVYVHTMAGRIMEIANCRPTTFVPINFGVGVAERFGGSVTCTGVIKRATARTAAGALFTPWADQAWHTAPDEDDFPSFPCAVSWASIANTVLEGMEGWTLTPQVQLTPRAPGNVGTVDFTVASVALEASCVAANLLEANLWETYAIGSSRALGTQVLGGDLTLAEDVGGVTAVVKNAVWRDPKTQFDPAAPIAGQTTFRSRRKAVTVEGVTSWQPAGTCAMTPAS
jgi:hypothetical protein